MRRIQTIALCSLLLIGLPALHAQTEQDSTASGGRQQKHTATKFIDENGDGIDDRLVEKPGRRQRGKDKFIDKDGDGICDTRASGLGFRRGEPGSGSGPGASGKGNGKQMRRKP